MFVVSMKTTRPRALFTVAVVGTLLLTMLVLSGQPAASATQAGVVTDDSGRREFLQKLGYETDPAEAQVQEIVIPVDFDEAFTTYNQLQQAAGYDLTAYRGKRVKCWTYGITNYPGNDRVQAHLYIYKEEIVGGDVSSTADGGFSHGLTPMTAGTA